MKSHEEKINYVVSQARRQVIIDTFLSNGNKELTRVDLYKKLGGINKKKTFIVNDLIEKGILYFNPHTSRVRVEDSLFQYLIMKGGDIYEL